MDNNPAQAQPVNSDIQEDAGETDDRGGQAVNSDTEDEDAADTDEVEANIASLVNLNAEVSSGNQLLVEDGAEQSSDLSDEDDMHDIDVGGILERGYPYLHDVETDMSPENLDAYPDLVAYDVQRSTEHAYLGTRLKRVAGIQWLEDGSTYKLPLIRHSVVIFPGDSVPMMNLDELGFLTAMPGGGDIEEEGMSFGLLFPKSEDNRYFGVTCQIYEMASAQDDLVCIKSHTRQRFEICRENNSTFFEEEDARLIARRLVAYVTILPETVMEDPLYGHETNSLSKFRYNAEMQHKLRNMRSASLSWPRFVYDMYDTEAIIVKIKSFLSAMQISKMPLDDIALSYWCGKNVLFDAKDRLRLFRTNSTTERMLIISKSLDYARFFVCKLCHYKLAHYNALFAMSTEGFQSSYCNPGGYIHETNTVTHVIPNALHMHGTPTLEFSWFPGYTWQLALCVQCNAHLGWKFVAGPSSNLKPKKFYGLAGRSIALWKYSSGTDENE